MRERFGVAKMALIRLARLGHPATQFLVGCLALALLTLLGVLLDVSLATAALLYLIAIVLTSLWGRLVPSILLSVVAALCLTYFFTPPTYSFRILNGATDMVALITFVITAFVITRLMSRMRAGANALREQADLLDVTHDAMMVRDMNDVITYWNRGAEVQYGWKQEEAVGKVTHQLLHTIFPAPLPSLMAAVRATGRWEGELVHTKRDGTPITVASRWSQQQDDRGRPVGTVETNNDITERTRAVEALRRQANLLEQTHDAIFVWGFPGPIIYWNQGAEQLYGFSREEAVGRLGHELLHTKHPLPTATFEAVLEREGEWSGELIHTARDDRKILVESRHVLISEADGRRLVLETNRDITARKQAEEALRKTQGELVHVARVMTMGELTTSIAHEVNQPLSGIVTNASACLRWLAGDEPNLEEARETARRIIRDGNRASDIVARIRALARKTATEKERIDLNDAIREVVALAQGEVRRNGVLVRTELAGDLPPVLGDRVQLQQVVLNLVINGIDAMRTLADRPRDLVITTQRGERDQVRVTVRDSGVGLDPTSGEKIFDAFYTTKSGGMGMGLSISRTIVEDHGGRLWAAPSDGPGATFQFTVAQHP